MSCPKCGANRGLVFLNIAGQDLDKIICMRCIRRADMAGDLGLNFEGNDRRICMRCVMEDEDGDKDIKKFEMEIIALSIAANRSYPSRNHHHIRLESRRQAYEEVEELAIQEERRPGSSYDFIKRGLLGSSINRGLPGSSINRGLPGSSTNRGLPGSSTNRGQERKSLAERARMEGRVLRRGGQGTVYECDDRAIKVFEIARECDHEHEQLQ
eukprot:gene12308-3619_t